MRKKSYILVAIIMIAAMVLGFGCGPKAAPEAGPIVIGYVGSVNSPATGPGMATVKVAIDEINEEGGILGRPVKYVMVDGKGEPTLTVQGYIRLITAENALCCFVEGNSEIALAVQAKAYEVYAEYPHILLQTAWTRELIPPIIEDYENNKFIFRTSTGSVGGGYAWADQWFDLIKNVVGAKKIAILYEDALWTEGFRNGIPELNLASWPDIAKKDFGFEVVYNEALKSRTGMYLPILEGIAVTGADAVFYCSSWFTDTEVFAKQWCESSARDIPIFLYAGTSSTSAFWEMTGGKALGITALYLEEEIPITSKTIPFVRKAQEKGIPLQNLEYCIYNTPYLIKAAIEKAGTTDIDALVEAMESVEIEGLWGKFKFQDKKINPFFHSLVVADPNNPHKFLPEYCKLPYCQYQLNGELAVLMPRDLATGEYIPPAELRKEAGWPGY